MGYYGYAGPTIYVSDFSRVAVTDKLSATAPTHATFMAVKAIDPFYGFSAAGGWASQPYFVKASANTATYLAW